MKCICGVEFIAINERNVYCSGRCRVREHMKRYRARKSIPDENKKEVFFNLKNAIESGKTVDLQSSFYKYRCGCPMVPGKKLCERHTSKGVK